jgi:hypothetical protein
MIGALLYKMVFADSKFAIHQVLLDGIIETSQINPLKGAFNCAPGVGIRQLGFIPTSAGSGWFICKVPTGGDQAVLGIGENGSLYESEFYNQSDLDFPLHCGSSF